MIQNLQITAVDADGNSLAGVNDTGFGEGETMPFDTETTGDFYFFVRFILLSTYLDIVMA